MKKFMGVMLVVLVLLSSTLFAGGSKEAENVDGAVRISYLSRYTNPEVPRHKFFLDKLDEFRALNPDIIVEDVSIAEADSYKSTLRASVAAGTTPTLFICSDAFPHLEWAESGVMSDHDARKANVGGESLCQVF